MDRPLTLALCLLGLIATSLAQNSGTASDPLAALDFLAGTWLAKTNAPAGTSGAQATGTYTFHRDLAGHVLARTSSADTCKGPQSFDCSHNDQLTIYPDPASADPVHPSLLALYLDSEGHVLHYTVTTPDAHTVIFLSPAVPSAPRFRLMYHLEGSGASAVMSGKFGMAPPGSAEYRSYLEWSGTKQ